MTDFQFDNIDGAVYNQASAKVMSIDAVDLFNVALKVQKQREDIIAAFERIGASWEALKLGWTGKTQTEQESFSTSYLAVIGDFFGAEDDPDTTETETAKTGVVNQFAAGLKGAANGYAQVESNLKVAFEMFADELLDIAPPQGDRNNYIPLGATWTLPDESTRTLPEGHRDSDAPPVTENVDKNATPWFDTSKPTTAAWTWTEERDGPYDLKIMVEQGATWTGKPNDKVKVEWVYDDTGKKVEGQ